MSDPASGNAEPLEHVRQRDADGLHCDPRRWRKCWRRWRDHGDVKRDEPQLAAETDARFLFPDGRTWPKADGRLSAVEGTKWSFDCTASKAASMVRWRPDAIQQRPRGILQRRILKDCRLRRAPVTCNEICAANIGHLTKTGVIEMIGIREVVFAATATIAASGTALAADLPTMKSAPIAPLAVPYNWSGLYVGAYAGGSFGTVNWDDIPFPSFTNGNSFSTTGFTAGGLAGYNYQIGALVIGAEGEYGYDGRNGGASYNSTFVPPLRHEQFAGTYMGRIRARAGFAVNNILLFVAGGVSFADAKLTFSNPANGFTQSVDTAYTGFNLGVGGEYAFTQNWIARIEYIYDGFGKQVYNYGNPPNPNHFDNRNVSWSENTIRASVAYKF
jgi:outer membrane immunogenic protein